MKCYLYARVSSREQEREREGFAIPAQRKLLREYAAMKRLTIVQEFIDIETAKAPGRDDFLKMLRLLETDSFMPEPAVSEKLGEVLKDIFAS
jgi:DNA invertase Pin-like site-specific DNA recombinase